MKYKDAPKSICVWDCESTGVDIENDRILTVYGMIQTIEGEIVNEIDLTINPGVSIPKGASDVHGMDDAYIQKHGRVDAAKAIREVAGFLDEASMKGYPIVGYNNSYDLGILDRELIRHGAVGLDVGLSKLTEYFDPIIYDRSVDKYRKGSRKLMDVARVYGMEIDESRLHEAKYDVIVTAKLAWKILQRSKWNMVELQSLQAEWKSEWASHLTEYFDKTNKTEDDGSKIIVDGSFPWKLREKRS